MVQKNSQSFFKKLFVRTKSKDSDEESYEEPGEEEAENKEKEPNEPVLDLDAVRGRKFAAKIEFFDEPMKEI